MEIIEITETNESIYPFAKKQTTTSDIKRTQRLLKKIYNYLTDFLTVTTPPSSVSFLSKNKRTCRIIVYDFKKILSEKNIFIVIFYGNKRENLSEELTKDFFNTDWEIAMSMTDDATILTYASQELHDENWFNIVLFTNESAKEKVTRKDKHNYAAYTLAPKRFTWIRLHNAILPYGINQENTLLFTKTKYYNFDTMWFAKRTY